MKRDSIHLAITSGEPAGIGPEISVKAAETFLMNRKDVSIHLIGDKNLFKPYFSEETNARLLIDHIDLFSPNVLGQLNPLNSQYVLQLLDHAYDGCLKKIYDAIVTAPIQKSVINQAGILFTGHTEYLAQKAGVEKVVMMLAGEVPGFKGQETVQTMRVALVTTHVPIQEISKAITTENVLQTIQIIHHYFKQFLGFQSPRIRACGLNPHAGENGYLGKEEIDVIIPAIQKAQSLGIDVSGPFPADTMFRLDALDTLDVYLAMYHDQGLIPLKMACFGRGVNTTLGLPFIRTSVDHGTALDKAGKGNADFASMYQALEYAYQMAKNGSSSS